MKRRWWILGGFLLAVAMMNPGALLPGSSGSGTGAQERLLSRAFAQGRLAHSDHEVWVVDQSDTREDGGGTLYIYDGAAIAGGGGQQPAEPKPEVFDLGGEVRDFCLEKTGSAPRRPHMIMFNAANTHAILAFVATGHVVFIDAATRKPVAAFDVGVQAHAAFPSPDQKYVVVANQNGKLLQRIATDYTTNTFSLDEAATLNLATGETPSGALRESPELRPDNAPICPIIDTTSRFSFVTLRGGGLFVVDSTVTPMAIVAEYDRSKVNPNGCGGVQVGDKMYINSGGGTAAWPKGADLYVFPIAGFSTVPTPPNTPEPKLVFSFNDRERADSHGAVLTKGGRFLWVADRFANTIVVVDTQNDAVVNEFSLAGELSDDPAPDLIDISPDGNRVYATLRGPRPLTANNPNVNNAVGSTPGLGVIRVTEDGRSGVLEAVLRISRVVDDVEHADPHGLAMRMK